MRDRLSDLRRYIYISGKKVTTKVGIRLIFGLSNRNFINIIIVKLRKFMIKYQFPTYFNRKMKYGFGMKFI